MTPLQRVRALQARPGLRRAAWWLDIHGPAGLHIGAANPAEIALSVAAQMVASWRGPK